jgi:RimJ/RimL family protein N-acetyltransferase
MRPNIQPVLENDFILLQPLKSSDFEQLYSVASDPLIWEQHPNKNRYQRTVFQTYFEGAMESKGAFLILDKKTGEIIGCSRFYDYNPDKNSILIGYTFIACKYWGKKYNPAIKALMINHAFQFCDTILFHVGASNIRSQIAIKRLGAKKNGEFAVAYHGENAVLNHEYSLTKTDWLQKQA